MWYVQVHGLNPQTGEPVSNWQCSVALLPLLMIENSKQQRSTAAAVESFRNESVKRSDISNNILMSSLMSSTPYLTKVKDITNSTNFFDQ